MLDATRVICCHEIRVAGLSLSLQSTGLSIFVFLSCLPTFSP
jgi:hypothetical protein